MARSNSRRQQDTIDLSLERGQVTTFVVGSVLALGAVFLLGVGYGRSLAEQPAAGAAARAEAAGEEGAAEVPALTFHDALTSERIEPPAPAAPAAPAAVTRKPEAEPQAADKAVAKASPADDPEARPEPEPDPDPAPAEVAAKPSAEEQGAAEGEGGFTVQVASSRERSHTDRLAEKLQAAGYDARVVAADIPGRGRWYRVRVGRYGSRADATLAQADLKVALDLSGIVVAN